ncbi:MAG: phosphate ABC transporter permease PstA [Planctomycetes bacterium]|nr:phosphate ABC transporter permease PstA [Planctomycetota bacterium]
MTRPDAAPPARPPVRPRIKGESLVWLTAMGLTIALGMVVLLLGVVASYGLGVFWPKHISEFTIVDGGKTVTVGGELVSRKAKAGNAAGVTSEEIQIYTGNKDAYGLPFRYVDVSAVQTSREPDDALVIERTTGGNAIGLPVALRPKGEAPLPASDPAFHARLDQLVIAAAANRAAVLAIRNGPLAVNAQRLSKLDARLKSMRKRADADAAQLAEVNAEIARLQAESTDLNSQAQAKAATMLGSQLVIRLFTGEEKRIQFKDVLGATWPNQLGLAGRCGVFVTRMARFVWDNPREANTEGGIFPAIFGTLVMTVLMSIVVTPFGVVAAIYLREYARQGLVVRTVRIAVNNLAGVPSIVFGVFGLGFFVYIVGGSVDRLFYDGNLTYGTGGILWAALTLALMTVPVVIVATEEAIAAVPRGAKEGSLACGASKWQTIQRVVLPASVPGILTGLILAMARGAGEVAPLMMVGVVKLAPSLPIDASWKVGDLIPGLHTDQKFMHLGFYIYDLGFQSPDSEAAKPMVFATTLFLIALVVALNLGAILLRDKLRRRLATATF